MPNSCCCGSIISFASTLEQSRKGKPEIRASSKLSNSNNNNHKYNYCHCHCHYPTIIGYRPETKGHKELLETRLQLAHMAKKCFNSTGHLHGGSKWLQSQKSTKALEWRHATEPRLVRQRSILLVSASTQINGKPRTCRGLFSRTL